MLVKATTLMLNENATYVKQKKEILKRFDDGV
jgi:hypothetical protein